jgi:glycosyltransferase involved in cell wall biosynthesis
MVGCRKETTLKKHQVKTESALYKQPKVSVVIPVYNSSAYIAEAIESVLGQTYTHFEIIVVDDGSTDKTQEILDRYRAKVKCFYQENRGVSAARNVGVRNAKGELIAFLDADDVWLPGKLEKQVRFLTQHAEVPFIFGDTDLFNDSGTVISALLRQKKMASQLPEKEFVVKNPFELLLDENFIPTSTGLVRRSVLMEAGGFDESLRSVEDRDLWLRIAIKHPMGCIPEVLSRKRLHAENISSDQLKANQSLLRVYTKILDDPMMSKRVDYHFIKSRLADLHFSLGYGYFKKGMYPEARRHFLLSLSGGLWLKPLAYFLFTLLGKHWVERLLKIKHG